MIKKILQLAAIVALATFGTSCQEKIEAGNVGVKFNLYGDSKGVQSEVVPPGRYWLSFNEELYTFPLFLQNYVWTQDAQEGSPNDEPITFQTVEGMEVGADVGISYTIDEKKVSILFQKYRRGVEEITDVFLRSLVRDAFVKNSSTMKVESVYGEGKTKLLESVFNSVSKEVENDGILVQKIYIIGSFRLPREVTAALGSKISALQKAEQIRNEVEQTKAEASKAIELATGEAQAILLKAKAEAEANGILEKSLTPQVLQYQSLLKWDGKLPQFNGGGAVPFININPSELK